MCCGGRNYGEIPYGPRTQGAAVQPARCRRGRARPVPYAQWHPLNGAAETHQPLVPSPSAKPVQPACWPCTSETEAAKSQPWFSLPAQICLDHSIFTVQVALFSSVIAVSCIAVVLLCCDRAFFFEKGSNCRPICNPERTQKEGRVLHQGRHICTSKHQTKIHVATKLSRMDVTGSASPRASLLAARAGGCPSHTMAW